MKYCIIVAACFLFTSLVSAEPADTISTGIVYAYGHELKAPYTLEIVENTVQVNGVQVFPNLIQAEEDPPPKPEERVVPEPQRGLWALKNRLKDQGTPLHEITAQMAEYMEAQEGVDSVETTEYACFWVYWTDEAKELILTYSTPHPTMEEQCQNQLESWRNRLESNGVIVLGKFTGLGFSGNRAGRVKLLKEEIERARTATAEELLDENWEGELLSAKLARLFNKPYTLTEE